MDRGSLAYEQGRVIATRLEAISVTFLFPLLKKITYILYIIITALIYFSLPQFLLCLPLPSPLRGYTQLLDIP